MYFVKTPKIARIIYRDCIWHGSRNEKKLYLTFDDGPEPEVTPLILQTLDRYGAKASFFMLGSKAKNHAQLVKEVINSGHVIGNHGEHHYDGWKTNLQTYVKNAKAGSMVVGSTLFRPPYGRMTQSQLKEIRKIYRIVMWDILSGDFDPNLDGERCFVGMKNKIAPGSIIVFHENAKYRETTLTALESVLSHFTAIGFEFCALE
jgi:peptidoglycan/xylan/chitin deacetylase (PgdA/CDA1 family)